MRKLVLIIFDTVILCLALTLAGSTVVFPEQAKTGLASRKHLERLTAGEIRVALTGKQIAPDRSISQDALQFHERFFSDGMWSTGRVERYYIVHKGLWSIKKDNICVQYSYVTRLEPICRDVWKDFATGSLFLRDIGTMETKLLQMNTLNIDNFDER